MEFQLYDPPTSGSLIGRDEDGLRVPDDPIVGVAPGDGIGAEIWAAARPVLEAAVERAYGSQRSVVWFELLAGESAQEKFGERLPKETVEALRHFQVGLKGPLATPQEGGVGSLNVELRRRLELHSGLRPVKWLEGVPCPVKHPEKLDLLVFRELTEDLHAGVEWSADSETARSLIERVGSEEGIELREGSALALKPLSAFASKRLVRRAIEYALERGRSSVTLVHEANVLPQTEGSFRDWGYELAAEEFGPQTVSEAELWEKYDGSRPDNKIVIKDRLMDTMFQQLLLRPDNHSVIAATNLNGQYLASALAAQAGGASLGAGASFGEEVTLFETAHGSAPKQAGRDSANPSALMLAGALLLEHLGWTEAGRLVVKAVQETIQSQRVTADLERRMSGGTLLSCSEFGAAVLEGLQARE